MSESIQIVPGMVVDIIAGVDTNRNEVLQRYIVRDWETPRMSHDGRWLFTAYSELVDNTSPMIVEPDRIRLVGMESCISNTAKPKQQDLFSGVA